MALTLTTPEPGASGTQWVVENLYMYGLGLGPFSVRADLVLLAADGTTRLRSIPYSPADLARTATTFTSQTGGLKARLEKTILIEAQTEGIIAAGTVS